MSRITWPMVAVGALALAGYGHFLSRPVQSQTPAPRLAQRIEQAPRPNADARRAQTTEPTTNKAVQAPPQRIIVMPCQSPGMATIHEKVAQIEKKLMKSVSTASLYPAQDKEKEPELLPPPRPVAPIEPPGVVVPPPSAPPPPDVTPPAAQQVPSIETKKEPVEVPAPVVPPPAIETKKNVDVPAPVVPPPAIDTKKEADVPPPVIPPPPIVDGILDVKKEPVDVPPPVIPPPASETKKADVPPPSPFSPTPPIAPPTPTPAKDPTPAPPTPPMNFGTAQESVPPVKKETSQLPPKGIVNDRGFDPIDPKPAAEPLLPAKAIEPTPMQRPTRIETTVPARPITSPWTFHLEIIDGKNIVTAKVGKTIQFRVSCDKVEVQSPHGNIQAQGNVRITSSGLEATTEKMTINLQEDAVILEGRAHLKCQREESGQEMELRSDRFNLRLSEIQNGAASTTSNLQRPPAVRFSRDLSENRP